MGCSPLSTLCLRAVWFPPNGLRSRQNRSLVRRFLEVTLRGEFCHKTRLKRVVVEHYEAVRWPHTRNVSDRHATMFLLISLAGILAASAFSTSVGSSLSDAKRRAINCASVNSGMRRANAAESTACRRNRRSKPFLSPSHRRF